MCVSPSEKVRGVSHISFVQETVILIVLSSKQVLLVFLKRCWITVVSGLAPVLLLVNCKSFPTQKSVRKKLKFAV